jgi:hypothetical protein
MNIQEAINHMGPEPVCASDILRGMGRGTGTSARKRLTDRLEAAEAAGEHGIRSVEGRFGDRLWVLDPDRACQPYKPEPTVKGPSVLDARAQAVGAYDYCECGKMAYRHPTGRRRRHAQDRSRRRQPKRQADAASTSAGPGTGTSPANRTDPPNDPEASDDQG